MRYLILACLLTACGSLRQDTAPAPIKIGQKRIETIICNSHEIGENGCVFAGGDINSTLKIYKINAGSLEIIGCGVDKTTNYGAEGEWYELALPKHIDQDCVITITQRVSWKGSDRVPFPLEASTGTVTLGTCPIGVNCSMEFEQRSLSQAIKPIMLNSESPGLYALSGCGLELIPPTEFDGQVTLPIEQYLPSAQGSGCMFILGIRETGMYKLYRKVWRYGDGARAVKEPMLLLDKKKLCYTGDQEAMASSVNGVISFKVDGCFKPRADGDWLRFYTSQGRSLIMFIKQGAIEWIR